MGHLALRPSLIDQHQHPAVGGASLIGQGHGEDHLSVRIRSVDGLTVELLGERTTDEVIAALRRAGIEIVTSPEDAETLPNNVHPLRRPGT